MAGMGLPLLDHHHTCIFSLTPVDVGSDGTSSFSLQPSLQRLPQAAKMNPVAGLQCTSAAVSSKPCNKQL